MPKASTRDWKTRLRQGTEAPPAPATRDEQPAPSVPSVRPAPAPAVQLGTRIPAELHQRLRVYCATERVKVQDVVAEALTAYLDAER